MLAEKQMLGERCAHVNRAPPEGSGTPDDALRSRPCPAVYGKVSFQLLILPVSCAAWSWTFSFQVPLADSDEAFTV